MTSAPESPDLTLEKPENPLTAAKRDALTDLAVDLIHQGGLVALTYRSLAKAAGVSVGTIQREFPSRELMLESVFERAWKRAGISPEDTDAPDAAEALFEVCSRAVPITEPIDPCIRAYFEILIEVTRNPALKKKVEAVENEGEELYLGLIERAQQEGAISRNLDAEDLLSQIWTFSDGLCLASYIYPDDFPPERLAKLWADGYRALVGADSD